MAGIYGQWYRDREVRRGNIRNSDIHRTMSGSLRKKRGAFTMISNSIYSRNRGIFSEYSVYL